MKTAKHPESGFTLVELLVVLAIIAMLFGLSVIGLRQPQVTTSVTTTTDTLVSDLKSQQLLAMVGDVGSMTSQQPHGIYIQTDKYTLFADSSYHVGDTNNFEIDSQNGASFTTTLPSGQIVFDVGSGDVQGFSSGSNTITVQNSGAQETITINRFGAVTVN